MSQLGRIQDEKHGEKHMRKCHVAGFAVVGGSALVCAMAIAGPPPLHYQSSPSFHYQVRASEYGLHMGGCEYEAEGYSCWDLYPTLRSDGFIVTLWEYQFEGTVYRSRSLFCYLSPDTLDVAGGARAAKFEALIDIARDGCINDGHFEDHGTGEYGPYEFPNSVSIRALVRDPWASSSSAGTGHYSTADGARYNNFCRYDLGDRFQDASVEINGSSPVIEFSEAWRSDCIEAGK